MERAFRTSRAVAAIAAFAAGALAGCGAPATPRPAAPRHAVLVTVDTLRADHVGRRFGPVELTPTISELARGSVRFAGAASVASETSPAVAALLTGLLPSRTGVVGNRHTLPDALPTLAVELGARGFATAAVVANPVLASRYGFARGFDRFELVAPAAGDVKARGDGVGDALARLLPELARAERLFLWLHYFDPHGPYRPPAGADAGLPLEAFGPPRAVAPCEPGQNAGFGCVPWYQQRRPEPSRDVRDYLRGYAAEVRATDAALGELLRSPALAPILADAVLVVTADHGEALAGDHGYFFGHGTLLSEDQVAVPLLLRAPGLAPRLDGSPASLVDVAPTLLRLLGLEPFAERDGRDLLGEPPGSIAGFGRHEEFVRAGSWKLRRPAAERRAARLYDLAADPGERDDRASAEPVRALELARALERIRRRPPLAEAVRRPPPTAAEAEELRSLGYL